MKNKCEDLIAAKEWYKIAKEQDNKLAIEILESKFPELKESEDERIRKEIISYLKRRLEMASSIPAAIGYWIAWLEKQGNLMKALQVANKKIGELIEENYYLKEKQSEFAWSKEDTERYESCLKRLGTGDPKQPETINSKWFREHVSTQPYWKPSDKQMHYLSWVANIKLGNSVVEQEVSKHLNELLEDLKKLREE